MGVTKAPDMVVYRSGIGAADSGTLPIDRNKGLNTANYSKLNVHVIPGPATSAPVVDVYVWSNAASKFIKRLPVLGITAQAAGVPYAFTIDCNGEILWFQVSGTIDSSNTVTIEVSAFGLNSEF